MFIFWWKIKMKYTSGLWTVEMLLNYSTRLFSEKKTVWLLISLTRLSRSPTLSLRASMIFIVRKAKNERKYQKCYHNVAVRCWAGLIAHKSSLYINVKWPISVLIAVRLFSYEWRVQKWEKRNRGRETQCRRNQIFASGKTEKKKIVHLRLLKRVKVFKFFLFYFLLFIFSLLFFLDKP